MSFRSYRDDFIFENWATSYLSLTLIETCLEPVTGYPGYGPVK